MIEVARMSPLFVLKSYPDAPYFFILLVAGSGTYNWANNQFETVNYKDFRVKLYKREQIKSEYEKALRDAQVDNDLYKISGLPRLDIVPAIFPKPE